MKFKKSDMWNLDITIARFVLPRLKEFKDKYATDDKKWQKYLSKMIIAFELCSDESNITCFDETQQKQFDEGIKLFAKYFRGLWT